MQKTLEEIIITLCCSLKEQFNDFHGLYLCGIFTDGQMHKGEDIEFVGIFDAEDKYKREIIWPIVGKIEADFDIFIDLHPITMEELKKDEDFYDEVVNDGFFFNTSGQRVN